VRVAVFGASGMVGQGVLRECLAANDVDHVVVVGRRPLGVAHPKLEEVVVPDVAVLASAETRLTNLDAAFFPLGTSSVGMSEAEYTRVTYDLTVAVGSTVTRLNPGRVTFVYVSGAGTDSTERGPRMWARVKGRTENALLRMPFRAAFMLRPGMIQPRHGARSRTGWVRVVYGILWPVVALAVAAGGATTTDRVGRAMLTLARTGYAKPILGNREINELGR
jgi:uncharacterized protein YbjT (DUF2867 family)